MGWEVNSELDTYQDSSESSTTWLSEHGIKQKHLHWKGAMELCVQKRDSKQKQLAAGLDFPKNQQ